MSNDKQISELSSKLDELQSLVERQIELTRQGSISEVEALSEQADSLAGKLVQSGILESGEFRNCLLYTSPSPRDRTRSRMPSSA